MMVSLFHSRLFIFLLLPGPGMGPRGYLLGVKAKAEGVIPSRTTSPGRRLMRE